jgi:hypothetical protein
MARANSEFFRYFLTLSSKKLRHIHIVLTPACCTLCAWTPRHSIRCYSSLKHLAFKLNAHLPLLLRTPGYSIGELVVIQLLTLCLGLYFFAHSSRYDFSPSRLLQLCFEALCSMCYCAFVNCWRQLPCCSFRDDRKSQLLTSSRFLDSNFSLSHPMLLWLKQLAVCAVAHFTLFDSTLRTFA